MFKNVIAGVDERQGGRDAIALAKGLLAEDGEFTLSYVHLGDATPVRGSSGAFEATERQRALELLETARAESQVEARLLCTGSPSVGRGLHELAERQHADLLVVGSTSRGLIGRVLIGDDTRDALNGAPCAVAIAPSGYSARPAALSEIGVGYDGSPESEHALAVARKLAAEHGARVSAFEAVSLPAYLFGGGAAPVEESINGFVEQARERIAALGDVEPHAAYGAAAEELALYGASVDLLVLGSRSYGPIGRLVHGSVSQQLARTARCPLLVLTRGARAGETSDESKVGREPVVKSV
jgi:nucleotide-binding universal stress UspA family protein